jgi:quercetin dioxygenase-like cupin family protein
MNASVWVGLLTFGLASLAAAQVPLSQEPRHRMAFENAQFRVIDVNVPPGDITLDHLHDFDIVTVSMNSGAVTRLQSPGKPWDQPRPSRAPGNAIIAEYVGKPASHRVENIGTIPYQLFAVENRRNGGWSTGAPLSAAATTLSTESRAFRVYDVRLGRDRSQTSHVHAVPTVAVLIGGKAMSEGSEGKAGANPSAPVGLKQLDRPGQWVFIPEGESHHLVGLGTGDVQIVEVEIR